MWAISPDDPQRVRAMRDGRGLTMTLLVDEGAALARRLGVLNESNPSVPHPTAIVVDREGVVRYVRVDEDYSVRPPIEELLAALD